MACLLTAGPARAANRQVLQGHVPSAVANLTPLGRLQGSQHLNLSVGLPMRNQAELAALLQQLYNPASPQYRHFLTPQQFTERFGPTKEDYQALKDFFQAHGFRVVGDHASRMVLDVEGPVPAVEKTFHVTMHLYRHPKEKRTFYAPDVEPSLDSTVPVLHISGLDNYAPPRPYYQNRSAGLPAKVYAEPRTGSGANGTYAGNDFRAAYVPGTTLTGAGQTVGLLEFDGYYANDITSYETRFGRSNIPLVNVPVEGGINQPGSDNAEVALDIEMAISMAPGISAVYVYEAPNGTSWDSILSRMANDNLAAQLSCSWGGGGPDATAEQIFQQMAAQGQSFFAASGDSDAYTGAIPFPSDSPHITVVGGTTLTTNGAGGSYVSEKVWNWGYDSLTGGYVGSSGGISTYYSIPGYQQAVSMASNQGSTRKRNVPDVAMTADNVFVDYNNGGSGDFGGTSCAAPLWAGFMALVNQQAAANGQSALGFINPSVYTLGTGANYASNFHDTTSGNNFSSSSPSKFSAATGYDLCTGWGTPAGTALINSLTGTATTSGIPVVTSATNVSASLGQSFGYQITASHNPTSYGASGLPPGLSLNTTSGFISGTPTANGTYSVPIAATNTIGTGNATLVITVSSAPVPVITSSLTASATNGVYFGYQILASNNPFSFGASGLPTGLNIDTTAGEISGTPTVTGTFNVTISATNSGGTGSATLVLTVAPPAAPSITAPLATLYTFNGTSIEEPAAGLVLGSDGNFYGTTASGGPPAYGGTVYQITPTGSVTILHTFTGSGTDGKGPFAKLTAGTDGNFYGTTAYGGTSNDGTVFKITPAGTLTTLFSFNGTTSGQWPFGGLLLGSDGNFYGTTLYGGANNWGTVFRITPTGTLTTMVNFAYSSSGANPESDLIQGSDGNFYGTTSVGGAYTYGTIFKMTPAGALTTLWSFSDGDGFAPNTLLQASDGNFYGTTAQGGQGNYGGCGTVFKLTPTGTLTTLHFFSGPDGIMPQGALVQASDGNFYGTTSYGGNPSNVPGGNNVGNGTVFMMTPAGVITTLTAFTYANGRVPQCALLPYDGNFYGTTASGGGGDEGIVFGITPFFVNLTVGTAFSYQITATGNPTSFGASGLPNGLNVNTTTGLISGTPTQSGVFNATISATNAQGTGTGTLAITVQQPPAITNPPLVATTQVNSPYNFTYTITGYPAPALSVTTGSLPNWLTLSPAGTISGTPTETGVYSGIVTASNGLTPPATQSFSITVAQAPAISSAPPPTLIALGSVFSFSYQASGFPAPTFSLMAGSQLPPGLALASNGDLTGTPTQIGTYTGTVIASNGFGDAATQNFTIVVANNLADTPAMPPWSLALLAALMVIVAVAPLHRPRPSR